MHFVLDIRFILRLLLPLQLDFFDLNRIGFLK